MIPNELLLVGADLNYFEITIKILEMDKADQVEIEKAKAMAFTLRLTLLKEMIKLHSIDRASYETTKN